MGDETDVRSTRFGQKNRLLSPVNLRSWKESTSNTRRTDMLRHTSLGAALCCLVIATCVVADEKPAHEFMTTSDKVKIHYLVAGHGTPVVLIHGFSGTAEGNWFLNGVGQALAKNHQVIGIDCRG